MTPKITTRPFLCRLGFHRFVKIGDNIHRCERAGCHRQVLFVGQEDYHYDKILCQCGAEIVPVFMAPVGRREGFWRNINTGEVCLHNHWHEPAR